ncbi:hypothetical protein [Pseudomonas danubii]|uniref:hypothetical protein n=1 Tax=Pseudomonas danubii TaxID=2497146 RepID=UPI003857A2B8
MKGIGTLALVVGICWAVFALSMDVSVATGSGDRVNNLGLMADRQLHTIVGGMIALAGLLMVLLGGKGSAPSATTASDTRPCPACAETIKNAAIKCRHCGADVAADTARPGRSLPEALASSTVTVAPSGPDLPKASSIEFKYLCFALICVIISAAIYHLTRAAPNVTRQPEQQAYVPKADDQIFLDLAAFGCMSAGDFDRAIDHYNRGEYSAWADITVSKYCFFQKDVSPDISWTVMQVRDGAMQVGLKRAAEYSKNPDLGRFNYWTLTKWATATRKVASTPAETVSAAAPSNLKAGYKSKPAKAAYPVHDAPGGLSPAIRKLSIGESVTIYRIVDGWARITPPKSKDEWIIPELLDW